MQLTITANAVDAIRALQDIQKQIMGALPGGINNITRKIRDTIYYDYRRIGTASPSYQNPSRSGLGFTDRTGALRSSISNDIEISANKIVGTVGAGMEYAEYVELLWGGRYSFLVPALMQNQQYIVEQVEESVIRGVTRAAKL